jgi:hypothetical protein
VGVSEGKSPPPVVNPKGAVEAPSKAIRYVS